MSKIVAVIDGMGGGIGVELVTSLRRELGIEVTILALGINAVATDRMMQAKADKGASGENAIRCSINQADVVAGPLGIVFPNGLMGETTAALAEIVMSARGKKVLLPVSHPDLTIIGVEDNRKLSQLITDAVEAIKKILADIDKD
jgi:NAD(P)-dependent dehydrogenase (short-subunit alcohol dehydrogenase family)